MSGPKRIGDLLGAVMAKYGYTQLAARTELENGWRETAGPLLAGRTRVGSLRHGVLEILVENSALLAQLEGFEKDRLLQELLPRLQHNRVTRLRFRRG